MEIVHILFFFCISFPGCMPNNGWSMDVAEMVTVEFGKDAVLPCTFKAPAQTAQESLTVIWRTTTHYHGPVIFNCVIEAGQNCSKPHGRYSLFGDPRSNNISLSIKNVSFVDEKFYFCRVQMSKSGSYETLGGTRLHIQVPPELQSIYIQTLASGEQFVTCDVKGEPPPTVTWIMPENTTASPVSVQRTSCSASSSVAYKPNTNYTCQIHGQNGLQRQSIYHQAATEQTCLISLPLFLTFVATSGFFFIIAVTMAALYVKGFQETTTQHSGSPETFQKDEDIYANVN